MGRHIFNLGHGILQHTPPENVTELLKVIREHDGGKT
jgi:uroporphyrinogen decarboxylase